MKYHLVATAVLAALPLSAAVELGAIAAKVNGMAITKKDVSMFLAPYRELLRTRYPGLGDQYEKALKEAETKILEELIDQKLVLSKLKEIDAKLPDIVLDEEIERIVRERYNGNEAAFREHLQKAGTTRRAFRESQREQILVQVFRQQQFKEVAPATDGEIREHFNKRRHDLRDRSKDTITFRKIFIPAADRDNPAATADEQLALAEKLASRIRDGADFAEIAIAHSADAFAADGGLWQDEERPDLEVGFGDIVFDTPEGDVVGPLKDPAGFTIVKVIKKRYGPSPPFDKEKDRMRKEVQIEKQSARYEEWLALLKRSAIIERNL